MEPGTTHSSESEIRRTLHPLENPGGVRLLGRSGCGNRNGEYRSESKEWHELHCGQGTWFRSLWESKCRSLDEILAGLF